MTATVRTQGILVCDLCNEVLTVLGATSNTATRTYARQRQGWRRDKIGWDVCPAHPKLKGSR